MSHFGETVLNAGSGGPSLATSTFSNESSGDHALMPWSALVYMASGNADDGTAVFQTVDASHGLPVSLLAGTNVIGHVIVDSGTVAISGSVAVTGTFWQATQPVSLASLPALPAGGNLIGQVEISDGTNVLGTVSHPLEVTVTNSGFAVIGSVTVGYVTPAVAGAATGATPFHLGGSAASTNATSVHAAACTLWDVIAINVSASAVAYLKIYDKASAPTVGTDTPVYVVPLPTAGSANGAGAARSWPTGLKLANGLAYAITGGMADSDTTTVAANQVLLSGSYG